VIATDRRQARIIMRYIVALLHQVPMLKSMIERQEAESVDLNNCLTIEVHSASIRTTRGYTLVAAILDEVAFWFAEDHANPDAEILEALRPAMATVPGALLLGLSSPYRRSGALYDAYRRHFGQDHDPVLVIQADTKTMNPTIAQSVIDRAYERDPLSAAAEYGAEFRSDVAGFLSPDWIDRAIQPGRSELPPLSWLDGQTIRYPAFADPSGGGRDAFTLAIAHREGESVVLDVLRGRRPPFDPSCVVADYAKLLKQYGCFSVVGDRYAGQWVVEASDSTASSIGRWISARVNYIWKPNPCFPRALCGYWINEHCRRNCCSSNDEQDGRDATVSIIRRAAMMTLPMQLAEQWYRRSRHSETLSGW
jgi:hypothetical protein